MRQRHGDRIIPRLLPARELVRIAGRAIVPMVEAKRKAIGATLAALRVATLGACLAAPGPRGDTTAATEATEVSPQAKRAVAAAMQLLPGRQLIVDVAQSAFNGGHTQTFQHNGRTLILQSGLRLALHANGHHKRAKVRLATGALRVRALPTRLGGGWLFSQIARNRTRVWRSTTWTAPLVELNDIPQKVERFIMGFDRIYLQLQGLSRLAAIDPVDGKPMGLGAIPHGTLPRWMLFADDWRAVVQVLGLGPMATFDAGHSWHRISFNIKNPQLVALELSKGDPRMKVRVRAAKGTPSLRTYRLSGKGQLVDVTEKGTDSRRLSDAGLDDEADSELDSETRDANAGAPHAALGRPALRLAIETGWPLRTKQGPRVAVVARHGKLAKVDLATGRILQLRENAFPESRAECKSIRVAAGIGFHCAEPGRGSVVYRYAEPLRMRRVARFEHPRYVAPSGTGALVVGGGCAAANKPAPAPFKKYCVLGRSGKRREIHIPAATGLERVVGMADGRVAILVVPSGESKGSLQVIGSDGKAGAVLPLRYPKADPRALAASRAGMWLRGFWETSQKNELAGWIEAGGPVLGLRIGLDGRVQLLKLRRSASQTVFGGRFALSLNRLAQIASSTSDGGRTWRTFDLPTLGGRNRPNLDLPGATLPRHRSSRTSGGLPASKGLSASDSWLHRHHQRAHSRGCSAVGCALRNWLVVGWGKAQHKNDLRFAGDPPRDWPFLRTPTTKVRCSRAAAATKLSKTAPATAAHVSAEWRPFMAAVPPKLRAGDEGIARSNVRNDAALAHAYAWGPKGSDWSQSGWWQVRARDPLDPDRRVLVAAPTRSIWSDVSTATKALGTGRFGYRTSLRVGVDSSANAALVGVCRYSRCRFFSMRHGEPLVPVGGGAKPPVQYVSGLSLNHAIQVGGSWYFEARSGRNFSVYRINASGLKKILSLQTRSALSRVQIARQLGQDGIALINPSVIPDPKARALRMHLSALPIEGERFQVTSPLALASLQGNLAPCERDAAGWLIDLSGDSDGQRFHLTMPGPAVGNLVLRLLINQSEACIRSLSGTMRSAPQSGASTLTSKETSFPAFFKVSTPGRRSLRRGRNANARRHLTGAARCTVATAR